MAEKTEKVYAKGIRIFPANSNAPDFVKGSMVIGINELVTWAEENPSLLSEYKGAKQIKLQILENDNGMYTVVDTWKPTSKEKVLVEDDSSDLPF